MSEDIEVFGHIILSVTYINNMREIYKIAWPYREGPSDDRMEQLITIEKGSAFASPFDLDFIGTILTDPPGEPEVRHRIPKTSYLIVTWHYHTNEELDELKNQAFEEARQPYPITSFFQ